jgi:hypothetical protein
VLDALPLLADGGIDRDALCRSTGGVEQFLAPTTPTEILIAEIWQELLGVSRIGRHDNFFDIGGHSLLSMRFIARLDRRTGVRLQHADIVVNTLEQLAGLCDERAAPATAAAEDGSEALSQKLFSAVKRAFRN